MSDMNDSMQGVGKDAHGVANQGLAKKTYRAPVLTLFGHVATLTRSANCSSNNDSDTNCVPGAMNGSMNT